MSALISVFHERDLVGEGRSSVAVDVQAPTSAPIGELGRVYVSSLDDMPLLAKLLFDHFCSTEPVVEAGGQCGAILENSK